MASKYIDTAAIIQVIGNVYNHPDLLDMEDKYMITENDFDNQFHKIMFGSIMKIYELGAQKITIKNIVDFLSTRPESEATFKANKGEDWLTRASENADYKSFDYYYGRLKKFSLLRSYERYGVDVSFLYDPDNITDVKKKQLQEEWLDNTTLEGIIIKIDEKIDSIKAEYTDNIYGESAQAGDGIDDLIESLKQSPEVGTPLYGALINTVTRGARLKKYYLRSAPSGFGKALPNSTKIPTPEGWKAVGDIKVGDQLFDAFGKPTSVRAVFPQGQQDVWEVIFKDGRTAKCNKDHLWSYCTEAQRTESKLNRMFKTSTTEEISKLGLKDNYNAYRILVPMQKAVEYSEKQYSLTPYTMGAILGDGSLRYVSNQKALYFSSDDEFIPQTIAKEMNWGYHKNSEFNYSWTFKWLENIGHTNVWVEEAFKDFPELWNVKSEDKFIPEIYLQGSVEQRYELLNGLLDTDGNVSKDKGRVTYFTISKRLCNNVVELCQSLGFKTSTYLDEHKETHVCYCVQIIGNAEDKVKLFKLPRKKELITEWYNSPKRKENNLFNPIVEIRNLGYQEEMTCFLVDNSEHLFLTNNFIVTHNTRSFAADACYMACNELYDNNIGLWLPNGRKHPTLFIGTEQDLSEIQTLMLAFISAVDEEHILLGKYEGDEEERVHKAAQILKDSPLYVECIPDFSIQDIENAIKKNIREHNITFVVYDYIHSSMKIFEEITKRSGGIKIREDNVLFMLSTKLKDLCNIYNIFILTGTQLNSEYQESETPDQNLLRGSKAIADRIDYGSIILPVTQKDLDSLKSALGRTGCEKPNLKISVYKNRRGRYKGIYLWCNADLGICRINPMFATDWSYNLVDIKETNIVEEEGAFDEA